jgi:hypothetical protein
MNIQPWSDAPQPGRKPVVMFVSVPLAFDEKTCPVCNAIFFGPQHAKYDSPACRARAYRAQRKATI